MIFPNLLPLTFFLIQSFKFSEAKLIVWKNLEEFKTVWKQRECDDGPGVGFATPSSVNPRFAPLDNKSTHGIWSGTPSADSFQFELDWTSLNIPKNCGVTSANLTVRYYFEFEDVDNNTDVDIPFKLLHHAYGDIFVYPCRDGWYSKYCTLYEPTSIKWATKKVPLDLYHCSPKIFLGSGGETLNNTVSIYLIDEVRLSYDGFNC